MALTVDNTSSNNWDAVSSYTCEHIVSSGANLLVVVIGVFDSSGPDRVISGVTFNGDTMTEAITKDSDTPDCRIAVYYRVNPDVGTFNVEVTHPAKVTSADLYCISYFGADTSDPVDATNTNEGSNSDPTVSITAAANTYLVGGMVITETDGTQISTAENEIGEYDHKYNTSSGVYENAGSGGSKSLDWSHTTDDEIWVAAVATFNALNTAPTVALGTPNHNATGVDTLPQLTFTGTDVDSDELEYQIQIDTATTFDSQSGSPLIDKSSATPDATFTGTGDPHPWPSGNQVTYEVQSADRLDYSTIYYWRVRAKDPLGTNTFGDWSPGDSTLGYDKFTTRAFQIVFLESGTDATYDFGFWQSKVGTYSSDSSVFNNGPRSMKFDSAGGYVVSPNVLDLNTGRISFYIRLGDTPTDEATLFRTQIEGDEAFEDFTVKISTSGELKLYDSNPALIDTGSAMSTGAWHRICITYDITSTSDNDIKIYVDGVLDISISNESGIYPVGAYFSMGWISDPGADSLLNIDDIYVDDDNSLSDTGNIVVTAKLPNANNTNNFDTNIGNNPANRWENVNERALSESNGWQQAGSGLVAENFGIQNVSTGDEDLTVSTIYGYMSWVWAKTASTSTAPLIYINGTEVASGSSFTSTAKTHFACNTTSTYPSNSAAVGLKSTGDATDTYLYECGMLIASAPPGAVGGDNYPTFGYQGDIGWF